MEDIMFRLFFCFTVLFFASFSLVSNLCGEEYYSDYVVTDTAEVCSVDKQRYTVINLRVRSGADITRALNSALSYGPNHKIVIPPGKYKISSQLRISYSYTWIYMPGVTIEYDTNASTLYTMLRNGRPEERLTGYCYSNILIEGTKSQRGAFKAMGFASQSNDMFHIVHAQNVTIRYLDFTIAHGGHIIETAAVKNVKINNCTFTGSNLKDTTANEAVQLDILHPDATGESYGSFDGTTTSDVEIAYNTFNNTTSGCGSHSILTGDYFYNIKINNNTFKNMVYHAIHAANYKNSLIQNNTITSKERGIVFVNMRALEGKKLRGVYAGRGGNIDSNTNSVISNNTVTVKGREAGIFVLGAKLSPGAVSLGGESIPAGDYTVKNLTISNNTIKTASIGILCNGVQKSVISGNTITQTANAPDDAGNTIAVTGNTSSGNPSWCDFTSSEVTVKSNTLDSRKYKAKNGILIQGGGKHVVSSNTIMSPWQRGIYLKDVSSQSSVTSNKISSTGNQGIAVEKSSAKVQGNTVTSPKTMGIAFYNACPSSIITKNTISTSGKHGVFVSKNSKTITISGNKITSAKGKGIVLDQSSATIRENTITSSKTVGIELSSNCPATSILKNTVKKSGKVGIALSSSTSSVTIEGNTVDTVQEHGIYLKSSVAKILSNKVLNHKIQGIYLLNCKKAASQVSKNTIQGIKKGRSSSARNIFVRNSKVSSITGNKCTNYSSYGIDIDEKSKNISCKDNTFAKSVSNNLIVRSPKKNYKVGDFAAKKPKAKKSGSAAIVLKWSKVSNASGYVVYRAVKNGSYSKIKTLASKTVTLTDKKLPTGKTYYYKVYAYRKITSNTIYSTVKKTSGVTLPLVKAKTAKAAKTATAAKTSATAKAAPAPAATPAPKVASPAPATASAAPRTACAAAQETGCVIELISAASDSDILNAAELAVSELTSGGVALTLWTNLVYDSDKLENFSLAHNVADATILALEQSRAESVADTVAKSSLPLYLAAGGKKLDKQNLLSIVDCLATEQEITAFANAYIKSFNAEPTVRALYTYFAVKAVAKAYGAKSEKSAPRDVIVDPTVSFLLFE